jgi:hypothetical protein
MRIKKLAMLSPLRNGEKIKRGLRSCLKKNLGLRVTKFGHMSRECSGAQT